MTGTNDGRSIQTETVRVLDGGGRTLRLARPLSFEHLGGKDVAGERRRQHEQRADADRRDRPDGVLGNRRGIGGEQHARRECAGRGR